MKVLHTKTPAGAVNKITALRKRLKEDREVLHQIFNERFALLVLTAVRAEFTAIKHDNKCADIDLIEKMLISFEKRFAQMYDFYRDRKIKIIIKKTEFNKNE